MKKTNYTIYSLKALACLCVIFLHVPFPGVVGNIAKHVARFAVPLFFMISGYYAFDYKNYDAFLYQMKKILKILLPGVLVYFVYNMYLSIKSGGELEVFFVSLVRRTNLEQLLIYSYPAAYTWVGHLWYLFALVHVYTFYMLKRNMKVFIPCILLGICFFIEIRSYVLGLNISTIYYRNAWFEGIPLFYLGYYMRKEQLKEFWEKSGV